MESWSRQFRGLLPFANVYMQLRLPLIERNARSYRASRAAGHMRRMEMHHLFVVSAVT
ncbi:hypothetical protein PCAR4_910022 [Paraburkholderia caribensis]|nr:hypothetical protein PCAR4_910022 [Paraburkholderia caribensis]